MKDIRESAIGGIITTLADTQTHNYVPFGLITGNTIVKRNITKGTLITEKDVQLDCGTTVWKL